MKRVCVIGAGFGGLALAIRSQAAGFATTLVEARATPGGCADAVVRDGFTFDTGPCVLTDRAGLEELWALPGHGAAGQAEFGQAEFGQAGAGNDLAADVTLAPVGPFCRLHWPDGTSFDLSGDEAQLRGEVARLAPADLAGYEDFARYCLEANAEARQRLAQGPRLDSAGMLRAIPSLMRHQAWRSLYGKVASQVRSEKLREALSFRPMMLGGNPQSASALFATLYQMEKDAGVWWPMGGMGALASGMTDLFQRLGGTLRLGEPVARIHTIGNRVAEVEGASGWREHFDAVASNADLMHTYRHLLGHTQRGQQMTERLAARAWSPGVFSVHFALEGSWPGIPHAMMLFGPRYRGLLDDIFTHGVLPRDMLIQLHHPSVTDPALAPPGKSVFSAVVPVANLGKLPIDWTVVGPLMEQRVLDEVGMRFIPDIHDRVLTRFHRTPRDLADELNAYRGSAYSLEPSRWQSIRGRAHNRDEAIPNLYLVGAGTQPGAGIGGVLAGAKHTAALLAADLRAATL